jgi:predicted enzyme related to lactoylglutathione lyase
MPERTSYQPGTPSWIDIGAPDVDAAAQYYSSLFGWSIDDLGPDAGGYRMAMLRGKAVAGLGPAQAPGPPYWTTYVTTADVDQTAAAVERAGGSVVVPPMDVLEAGRMAVFQDPEGAFISAWQPNQHIGAEIVNEHGALCWNELDTRDLDKAKAFYGEVFGWSTRDSESYSEWMLGEQVVGGAMVMDDNFPPDVPPNWLVYFAVDDLEATVAEATRLGATVIAGSMTVEVGTFAVLADPQGAVSAVIELSALDD